MDPRLRVTFDPGTWLCHVCDDERPDGVISVYSEHHTTPTGVEFSVHVRYCNDRQACIEGAPAVAQTWVGRFSRR